MEIEQKNKDANPVLDMFSSTASQFFVSDTNKHDSAGVFLMIFCLKIIIILKNLQKLVY